ncbi:MAG: hypothetical protein NVSMB28_26000 [Collimonas sp.]
MLLDSIYLIAIVAEAMSGAIMGIRHGLSIPLAGYAFPLEIAEF